MERNQKPETSNQKKNSAQTKQLVRFGLILSSICFIASLVLAVTYEVTKPVIEAQARSEEEKALAALLPEADRFEKKDIEEIEYYSGYKKDRLIGYCVKAVGNGYGGFFHMIVAIGRDGIIKGIEILDHQETPGLGSKIKEIRQGEDAPWFLRQFKGKDGRKIQLKDIDAITGATISSRAVTDTVNKSINEFLAKVKK